MLSGLDWVLSGVLFFGILRGLWRGAITQICGIIGALGGFLLAAHYYQNVASKAASLFPRLPRPEMIAFATLFILTWVCLSLLGRWLSSLFRRGGLGGLDRFLGAGVGAAKAILLAIILVTFLTFFLPDNSSLLRDSRLVPYVHSLAQLLIKAAPPDAEQIFRHKQDELKRHWNERKQTALMPGFARWVGYAERT
jgi:membrane protein required for colicin V production